MIMTAVGGENVTTTVEGRERYARQRPLPARAAATTSTALRRVLRADAGGRRRSRSAQLADVRAGRRARR